MSSEEFTKELRPMFMEMAHEFSDEQLEHFAVLFAEGLHQFSDKKVINYGQKLIDSIRYGRTVLINERKNKAVIPNGTGTGGRKAALKTDHDKMHDC